MRNLLFVSSALAAASLTAPLAAQAPAAAPAPAAATASIAVGAKVEDTSGGEVGTITAVEGAFATLKTDLHEVRLPSASFTPSQGVLLLGMTRAQVNAAVAQSQGSGAEAVVAGATVRDTAGGVVGTVDTKDAQLATVTLAGGAKVQLPLTAFAKGVNGPVIGMTAAQLQAQVGAATPAAATEGVSE